jgi:endonuclease-3
LLIAVLLSAQCTDVRVNQITPLLFAKADNPYDMIKMSVEEIKEIIRPCGLSPMKSKGIHGLSHILIDQHNGEVPQSFEALEALPAVGHKTASVVMSQAFGVPAFPVDTHIHRLMFHVIYGTICTCKLFGTVENIRLLADGVWRKTRLHERLDGKIF